MKTFKQFISEAYKVNDDDRELIFRNSDVLVYKIFSRAAAIKYGAGTRWCVTDKDSCYHWDLYRNQSDDNQFYIIVNKKAKSDDPYYRIAIYVKDSKVVYPYNAIEKDEVMDKNELINFLNENSIPASLFTTRSGKEVSYFNGLTESIVLNSDKEYIDILKSLYPKDFVNMILTSDDMAQHFTGKKPTIESTGNILVKYSHGNGYACIMGMLSKNGHITKSDYKDILIWGERIKKALEDGDKILTSTNEFSKPILLKLIKNMDVDIDVLQTMTFPFGTWETIQIEMKE